jgi:hypothetical protein
MPALLSSALFSKDFEGRLSEENIAGIKESSKGMNFFSEFLKRCFQII